MAFPMNIVRYSGRARSSSGGKDYHIIQITNDDGAALVINRWAKAQQWGNQLRVEQFINASDATDAYNRKYKEKFGARGEYREALPTVNKTVNNHGELVAALGPQYWGNLGANNIKFLLGDAATNVDLSKIKDPKETEWEKDANGNWRQKHTPKTMGDAEFESALEKKGLVFGELPPEIKQQPATPKGWGDW